MVWQALTLEPTMQKMPDVSQRPVQQSKCSSSMLICWVLTKISYVLHRFWLALCWWGQSGKWHRQVGCHCLQYEPHQILLKKTNPNILNEDPNSVIISSSTLNMLSFYWVLDAGLWLHYNCYDKFLKKSVNHFYFNRLIFWKSWKNNF